MASRVRAGGEQTCLSAYFSLCSLAMASRATWEASKHVVLPILALLHFVSCFPSLLSALSNFPAKLGKVR